MDMAGRTKPPTVRLRRLSAELKRLRSGAALTREQVEEQTGITVGTLYRLEMAKARPQKRTLLTLLDLYGMSDPAERTALTELARNAGQLGWLQRYEPDLPEDYQQYITFESEASRLYNYESLYVPGLLQTEAYARAVIRGGRPEVTEAEIEQRVEVRLRRQQALAKEPAVGFWAVVDEAAVRRVVGGAEVQQEQLRYLVEAAESPNITIQVINYAAGAHPGMPGPFLVMEFPEPDPALIYTENASGGLFLEAESDVQRYRATFQRLTAQALSPDDTVTTIRKAAESA
jgi:transcriptional regulator with XRE-family HTH domain